MGGSPVQAPSCTPEWEGGKEGLEQLLSRLVGKGMEGEGPGYHPHLRNVVCLQKEFRLVSISSIPTSLC